MPTTLPQPGEKIAFGMKFPEINDDVFGKVDPTGETKVLSDFQIAINNMNVTQVNFALTMLYDKLNGVQETYQFNDTTTEFDWLYDTISSLEDNQAKILINKLLTHGGQKQFKVEVWKGDVIKNFQSEE